MTAGLDAERKTILMYGRAAADRILASVADRARAIREAAGTAPTLATVLVGDDQAAIAYTRMKQKRCAVAGIESTHASLPGDVTSPVLIETVRSLAQDPGIHGIVIQHPVPKAIDKRAVFEQIPLAKDVDGVTSGMLGRMILGMSAFAACTPEGIMRLLKEYDVELDGAHAVVIGRSPIIGRPMASMLINAHATVTLCHSRTRGLPDLVRQADVLIAAVGRPKFVQGSWIKPGAVVVDAGYNPGIIGDVDFDSAVGRASRLTPVPGGVGPMTIAVLLSHTVDAAAAQLGVNA